MELAQNAADAAARAGVPGRLRLTLRDDVPGRRQHRCAAGRGGRGVALHPARLGQAGRRSAVGRFGVGFAAVLAVSDEPAVVGRTGGVRWSLAEARDLARETAEHNPGLADELRRRDGHVPLLRLPLPAEGSAPDDYDTAVVLPLRDGAAADLTARLLAGIDDALLLALPGLAEVVIDTPDGVRTLTQRQDDEDGTVVVEDSAGGTTRWRVRAASGTTAAALLEDRPVEERNRPGWTVTWAVPVDADGAPARPRTASVVHAPTPTDEPLGLPALLIASFPLDPTRRHVAAGPLTDFLALRAAETYVELLAGWRPVGPGIIDLVPGPLGQGELDAELRRHILELLPRTEFLPPAHTAPAGEPPEEEGDAPLALRPDRAELIEGAAEQTVQVLAEVLPLPAARRAGTPGGAAGAGRRAAAAGRRDRPAVRRGTAGRLVVPALRRAGRHRSGAAQRAAGAAGRRAYGRRAAADPAARQPTAHCRTGLARLGLRVVHPDAAHPLLEKLGALPATPRAVLTTPQVRAAVAGSLDAGEIWDEDAPGLDADELADLVLALVRDADLAPGDEPWLGALALPDDEGELSPASELVLPGSPFEQIIRPDELGCVDQDLADRWGERPLTAVGVLATFTLVRAADVVLDPDDLEPRDTDWAEPDDPGLLDAVDVWCEDVLDQLPESDVPPVATEISGVRDLDLVDDDAWPQALALLAQPPLRDAVTTPVRVLLPDGTTQSVRSLHRVVAARPPGAGRPPPGRSAGGRRGPAAGRPLRRGGHRLGGRRGAAGAGGAHLGVGAAGRTGRSGRAAGPDDRPGARGDGGSTARHLRAVGRLEPEAVTLPDELRAVVDGRPQVVDATEALVADAPDLMPLSDGRALLPAGPAYAADLAELFQVRRLSEEFAAPVVSRGEPRDVPDAVRELLPGAPLDYLEHEELLVDGPDGEVELDWRLVDGTLHAATLEGVAAGLAWAAGEWQRRFEVAALLEDLTRTEELATARWFD